ILCVRSRLHRFHALICVHTLLGIFRRAHQRECFAPAALLSPRGQVHWCTVGSHRHSNYLRIGESVSRSFATRQLLGCREPAPIKFLTNNFQLPALKIAQIYKCRWQVELFFKWIKQHLRIKAFYGTSDNAVKTQIWIAVSVYVLVAIVRKRLGLDMSLYQILQIFSITLLEKMPILSVLEAFDSRSDLLDNSSQLILLDF